MRGLLSRVIPTALAALCSCAPSPGPRERPLSADNAPGGPSKQAHRSRRCRPDAPEQRLPSPPDAYGAPAAALLGGKVYLAFETVTKGLMLAIATPEGKLLSPARDLDEQARNEVDVRIDADGDSVFVVHGHSRDRATGLARDRPACAMTALRLDRAGAVSERVSLPLEHCARDGQLVLHHALAVHGALFVLGTLSRGTHPAVVRWQPPAAPEVVLDLDPTGSVTTALGFLQPTDDGLLVAFSDGPSDPLTWRTARLSRQGKPLTPVTPLQHRPLQAFALDGDTFVELSGGPSPSASRFAHDALPTARTPIAGAPETRIVSIVTTGEGWLAFFEKKPGEVVLGDGREAGGPPVRFVAAGTVDVEGDLGVVAGPGTLQRLGCGGR